MKTLIFIPAYNEEENIARVVDNLVENYPQYDYVVINDGSRDRTAQICRERGYHLIDLPVNLGLSGAFQTGMRYAAENGYDAAVQFDADGQHLPEYIAPMEEKLAQGNDIVIASRFVTKKKPHSLRMLGSTGHPAHHGKGPPGPHQRNADVQPPGHQGVCLSDQL